MAVDVVVVPARGQLELVWIVPGRCHGREPTSSPDSLSGVPVDDHSPLALTVGCTFGLETPQAVTAVMQVAPSDDKARLRDERWDTGGDHHGYTDLVGNRCERVTIPAGHVADRLRGGRGARVPRDRIAPGTPETPITALPDEYIGFLMPSRFCLPDELGPRGVAAVRRHGPGWERVQAIVDFVHNHLEWVARRVEPVDHRRRRLPRRPGRVPRLRPRGHHVLPRAEHPRALRVRLHPRDRRPAAGRADGLRRLVRGLPGRARGTRSTPATTPPGRPGGGRPRPRRGRRGRAHVVRPGRR